MIGNCLVMGVDWRTIGWPEYQITLAGWNAQHDGDGPKDFTRLKRAMEAHTVH